MEKVDAGDPAGVRSRLGDPWPCYDYDFATKKIQQTQQAMRGGSEYVVLEQPRRSRDQQNQSGNPWDAPFG